MTVVRLCPLLFVVACAFDADDDGLTNKEEQELGLDPQQADTDSDGLSDGEEIELGTDPLAADVDEDGLLDGDEIAAGTDPFDPDTDGDGYGDRDEIHEGKDPLDDASVIYKGGWPYYFEKDDLPGQRGGDGLDIGKRFRRFQLVDQYGDSVDLFDFHNDENKYIVVDISAEW
ncbi:MAG: thrombospondin type 3 repeat-containing protein [Myxococcales bacterium]|nr:thrombospondin type 3 repeat-containing protein [Myxococcales bacterium]